MRFWTNRIGYSISSTVLVVLALLFLWAALRLWYRPAEGMLGPAPEEQVLQVSANSPAADGFSLIMPVEGEVVCRFGGGFSSIYEDFRFNRSIELKGQPGAVVRAAASGVVEEVRFGPAVKLHEGEQPVPAYYTVAVRHEGGYRTQYRGLGKVSVLSGQSVSAGEGLGELPAQSALLEFALEKDGVALDPFKYLAP